MIPNSGGVGLQVRGFTDAIFQSDKDDCKSQSGYIFTLNAGAVSWKSSKQVTTADSTAEAEYIAASEAAKEAVLIKKFITELEVVPTKDENIGFDGYIGNWILRIYRIYQRYIGGYFYMNIDISEINKNTLKLMETLYKSVKMTLIMKYRH